MTTQTPAAIVKLVTTSPAGAETIAGFGELPPHDSTPAVVVWRGRVFRRTDRREEVLTYAEEQEANRDKK